jgi:hypothetical protein
MFCKHCTVTSHTIDIGVWVRVSNYSQIVTDHKIHFLKEDISSIVTLELIPFYDCSRTLNFASSSPTAHSNN